MFDFKQIFSVTLILFSVIDILGSLPIILDLKKKVGRIESEKATLAAGGLMTIFLFLGESILALFGLDVQSFSIAGAIILFFLGMEMVLGIHFFRGEPNPKSSSIVPIAFPLIAGSGTITTIISLRAEYEQLNILLGILFNLLFVYLVLRMSNRLEQLLGQTGMDVVRKVFGVILLAVAIKLFKTNLKF